MPDNIVRTHRELFILLSLTQILIITVFPKWLSVPLTDHVILLPTEKRV